MKTRKHLFQLLAALRSSPQRQDQAVAFVSRCTGISTKLLIKEATMTDVRRASVRAKVDFTTATDGLVFWPPNKYYVRRPDGSRWEERNDGGVVRILNGQGLNNKSFHGEQSEVQAAMLHLNVNNSVVYAGPQTAFPAGLHPLG